jgi:3-methylcrotonyl-CoA carboxylase alpha subunit
MGLFTKILIANRGEIACRVIRTCKRLGIRTVAVYSEADARAQHVTLADEAVAIGPAPARESYLVAERIIAAAKATGAEAIHPGYGFLSENGEFAQAVADAGLVFIGPPPSAIHAMGSKSAAKALMVAANVPVVPGYHGEDQSLATFEKEAARIGYPVLIKASAGGGGKGMRVVAEPSELASQIEGAKREALKAFGDDHVLIEKYLQRPRHIEVQVFGDTHGQIVYLFERDCSVQRRHQKVFEEAPGPRVTPEMRERLGKTACEAARAIGYTNAGTIEFIADQDGQFFFMEMNTRLQVEHPVTEMVTGQDLVEWQLRVAAGERLPLRQDDLKLNGSAIEVRVYAEDPSKDFLPAVGRISHLGWPVANPHLRVETGVRSGDEISIHYDPMIAKLVVWGEDRATALRRLAQALRDTHIAGLVNNTAFLLRVAEHPEFVAGDFDTGFIGRNRAALIPETVASPRALAFAAFATLAHRKQALHRAALRTAEPHSPWANLGPFRLNAASTETMQFKAGETTHTVTVTTPRAGSLVVAAGGETFTGAGTLTGDGALKVTLTTGTELVRVVFDGPLLTLFDRGETLRLEHIDPLAIGDADHAGEGGNLTAPMPGKVIRVMIGPGTAVKRGTPLLILEAMKMEHTITAPVDGTLEAVHFAEGDLVKEGETLAELKPAE